MPIPWLDFVVGGLCQQLQQSRDVASDPPRLIRREHLRLPRLGLVLARVDIGQRLPVGVMHDIAARYSFGAPGGREAA
jgi:hypothetical protein